MTTVNRRIATRADVEAPRNEPESETVDYKGKVDRKAWWEMAKDLAAFANHLGGVIVVGAFPKASDLPELRGIDPDEVTKTASAYEHVARDRCRPSPLVTCDRIPWDEGREMLAVNVQAHASGLVGAQFYELNNQGAPESANAWQFPIRSGKHNPPLPLEQAIMHMSTHARRIAILLSSVTDRANVNLIWSVGLQPPTTSPCSMKAFRVEENVADFILDGSLAPALMPLDDIEAVWREGGRWSVRVSGYFAPWPVEKRTRYYTCPQGGP